MPVSGRLLAIDDNSDNLALLGGVLSDYELEVAKSGPDGIALARSYRPDLILLDVQMPGMDGFATLGALHSEPRTAKIPVILLTAAYCDALSIDRGLALGATEYLTKPIQAEELRVRIRGVLRVVAAERELDRLRRDFASMLLHDVRTPLESVRLALALLERTPSPEQRKELRDMARGGLAEVGDLIEDLISAHRLDDGEIQLDLAPVCIAELAREVLDAASLLAKQRQMTMSLDAPADLLGVADRRILKRILGNLVSNSLKYAEPGPVVVAATLTPSGVKLFVKDTGPGMSPEVAARAFDRFYQETGRNWRSNGSFGLGLAFCRQAVQAHGGEIGVETAPGCGTKVWFTLPSAQATLADS